MKIQYIGPGPGRQVFDETGRLLWTAAPGDVIDVKKEHEPWARNLIRGRSWKEIVAERPPTTASRGSKSREPKASEKEA